MVWSLFIFGQLEEECGLTSIQLGGADRDAFTAAAG